MGVIMRLACLVPVWSLSLAAAVAGPTFAPTVAWAQEDVERQEGKAGAGFFGIGGAVIDIGDLNSRLEALGYPTFGRTMLSMGGGGYGVVAGRLLVGGEGYGLLTGEEAHRGRPVSVNGGYGLFNVGYVVRLAPRARAYPLLGLGAGGTGLRIGTRPTGDSFDDVIQDPDRSSNLSRGSLLVSLGAGAEWSAPVGSGFLIGVRAGYLFAPFAGSWRLDDNRVSAGPDASLAGPYLRFMIGGGGGGR